MNWRKVADVATYEFENVNAEAVERVAESIPVLPGIKVLRVAQNRLMEKAGGESGWLPGCQLRARGFPGDFS